MPCQCEQCSPTPSPTWTVSHRMACLARHVAGLPYAQRKEFFGKQSIETLRNLYREKDLSGFKEEIERAAKAKK